MLRTILTCLLFALLLTGCKDKTTAPTPAASVVFSGWSGSDGTYGHGTVQNNGTADARNAKVITISAGHAYTNLVGPPILTPGGGGTFSALLTPLGGYPEVKQISWE